MKGGAFPAYSAVPKSRELSAPWGVIFFIFYFFLMSVYSRGLMELGGGGGLGSGTSYLL